MHRNKEVEIDVINDNPNIANIDDIRIACCEREYTSSGLECYKKAAGAVEIDEPLIPATDCNCLYNNKKVTIDEFIEELVISKIITKSQALKYTLDYTPSTSKKSNIINAVVGCGFKPKSNSNSSEII